jgi:NADH-quinone oxidoreductase subunit M
MSLLALPWLDIALALALVGAVLVSRVRDAQQAFRAGVAFTGAVFVATLLAWADFYLGISDASRRVPGWQPLVLGERFGGVLFAMDDLNAPLLPTVALLHFLIGFATPRTKMRRFSFSWSLASEAIRLALFACNEPWVLVGLLALESVPPFIELRNRGKPTRVFILHMVVFVLFLTGGQLLSGTAAGPILLMLAILVRCGTAPLHCWITDWFEHASFGNALLFVAPLAGVYAAVRLLLPTAPEWVLQSVSIASLITAVYGAALGLVQREVRRFFSYLFVSHASLVLVGLEMHTPVALTGAFCLWFSAILSLGGFGLVLRALEARYGRLSLANFHGLYDQTPTLAVSFLLTGLAAVGFPGTLGFVSAELLVDGAIEANLYVGLGVLAAAAINGIAVIRVYFLIFTGARHHSTVFLGLGLRERIAVLTLVALILGGFVFPQPGVDSRYGPAEAIVRKRIEAKLDPIPEQHVTLHP